MISRSERAMYLSPYLASCPAPCRSVYPDLCLDPRRHLCLRLNLNPDLDLDLNLNRALHSVLYRSSYRKPYGKPTLALFRRLYGVKNRALSGHVHLAPYREMQLRGYGRAKNANGE